MVNRADGGGLLIRRIIDGALSRLVGGGGVIGAGARLLAALAALRPRMLAVDAAILATPAAEPTTRRLKEEWSAFRAALAGVEAAAGEVRRALRL